MEQKPYVMPFGAGQILCADDTILDLPSMVVATPDEMGMPPTSPASNSSTPSVEWSKAGKVAHA